MTCSLVVDTDAGGTVVRVRVGPLGSESGLSGHGVSASVGDTDHRLSSTLSNASATHSASAGDRAVDYTIFLLLDDGMATTAISASAGRRVLLTRLHAR